MVSANSVSEMCIRDSSSTDACRSPLAEGRFGASDAVPLVEATTLRDALEKELNAHPETHERVL